MFTYFSHKKLILLVFLDRASVCSQDGVEILLAKVWIDPSIHCHTVPLRAVPTQPTSDWLTDFTPQQLICACHVYTARGSEHWSLVPLLSKKNLMTHKHTPLIWLVVKRNLEYLICLLINIFKTSHFLSFLSAITSKYHLSSCQCTHKATGNFLWGQVCNFSISISIMQTSAS